jgi:hypothetical protein
MTANMSESGNRPNPILWIKGLPDDEDDGELEMRLARVGELIKLDRNEEVAVATFRNTRAAVEAKDRLDGYTLASGRSVQIEFAVEMNSRPGDVDKIANEFIRSNREIHWKIGQLVRSTYSAMRATNGNYPPPKQVLVPEDFKYLKSKDEETEMESKWSLHMSIEDKIKDYDEYADRRPFHNRYVVVKVREGTSSSIFQIGNFIKSVVGAANLMELLEFNNHSLFHASLKSTRDASMILSAINAALSSGDGDLVRLVSIESVKYGPPVDMANNPGKLWLGCSAFQAVDEGSLSHMMRLFGEVENFRLVRNKNCLFVTFKSEEDAVRCRNKLFAYEIAPGHFLNIDFAPPAPEYPEHSSLGQKRRFSETNHPEPAESPPQPTGDKMARIDVRKMGEYMCSVLARKFVIQKKETDDMNVFIIPVDLDICNRTKVEYCKTHIERLGCKLPIEPGSTSSSDLGTIVMWQFAAASERDCRGYDTLCDYFVSKDRVGFFNSPESQIVTYFIPPVKSFLEVLGLPWDTKYLTAVQMPSAGQVASNQ